MATATEAICPGSSPAISTASSASSSTIFASSWVVVGLCPKISLPDSSYVVGHILPGIAISLVAGNLFYAWQAVRLLAPDRANPPVFTALPFGVDTVSLFAFIFLIMGPIYTRTARCKPGLARRHLCQHGERHRADCGSLMHRLAAPQHAARRARSPRWPALRLLIFAWASSSASSNRRPSLCSPCWSSSPSTVPVSDSPIMYRRLCLLLLSARC